MRKFSLLVVSVAMLAGGAASAERIGCDTLFPAAGAFSIILKEGITLERTDSEGRIAVGGDAKFSNCSIGTKSADSGFSYDYAILVGGRFTFREGSVWTGAVGVGGVADTALASFQNGVRRVNPKPTLDAFQAEISAAAAIVATHRMNGTVTVRNERLDLVSTATDLAVFDLNPIQLGAARELFVDIPEGASMLIRVSGTAVALNRLSFYYRGAAAEKTLFSFPQATLVELDRVSVEGSVLAAGAQITFRNGEMNGNLYARGMTGNGRVNQVRFAGCLRP